MAFTSSTNTATMVSTVITDTNADLTINQVATQAQNLYFVEITNPNASGSAYVKIFAAASGVTLDTQHLMQFYCPPGTTCYMYMKEPIAIANGLAFYCSSTRGLNNTQTNPQSAPSKAVTVKMGISNQ